jgi:hypothetical protein
VQEHRDGRRTTIVGAPNEPPCIWRIELVDDRADVVEICGGTPLTTAARVLEAAGDSATVGLVSWPFVGCEAGGRPTAPTDVTG